MDIKKFLLEKLDNNYYIKEDNIVYKEIECANNIIDKYRLMGSAFICEEDLGNNLYVVEVKTGFLNAAKAYASFMKKDNKLYILAYGKEGLIKQNLAEKAIDKIMDIINYEK